MRAEKKYLISEVETHLKKSDYVILANFTKVTVADVAELRKRLDAEKAEFHVVKNSSLRVAAKALGLPEFESALTGPTAVVVGGKNSAGVAKILKQFFKDKQKLEVKVGVLDKKIVSAADLARIAAVDPGVRVTDAGGWFDGEIRDTWPPFAAAPGRNSWS